MAAAAPAAAGEPIVSVWYRGNPAGIPRQSDLGAIRALGFNGVTWPRGSAGGTAELERLAAIVGLKVTLADRPVAVTAESALAPADAVNLVVTPDTISAIPALAWRAVAHGARTISFDAGEKTGAGLEERDGSLKPWARAAIAIARQLTGNARLVDILKSGPGVTAAPSPKPAFDVVLLDGGRSWVIVATNASKETLTSSVRLPAGAPYAMWISWIDGAALAMADEPPGPRWSLTIAPGAARVYLIDKVIKNSP